MGVLHYNAENMGICSWKEEKQHILHSLGFLIAVTDVPLDLWISLGAGPCAHVKLCIFHSSFLLCVGLAIFLDP